jgi:hypothetical protein
VSRRARPSHAGDGVYCESLPCPCTKPAGDSGRADPSRPRQPEPTLLVACARAPCRTREAEVIRVRSGGRAEGASVRLLRGNSPGPDPSVMPRAAPLPLRMDTSSAPVGGRACCFHADAQVRPHPSGRRRSVWKAIATPRLLLSTGAGATGSRSRADGRPLVVRAAHSRPPLRVSATPGPSSYPLRGRFELFPAADSAVGESRCTANCKGPHWGGLDEQRRSVRSSRCSWSAF